MVIIHIETKRTCYRICNTDADFMSKMTVVFAGKKIFIKRRLFCLKIKILTLDSKVTFFKPITKKIFRLTVFVFRRAFAFFQPLNWLKISVKTSSLN